MDELEREAVALVRQYGFALVMVKPLRALLGKIADRLNWQQLKREL